MNRNSEFVKNTVLLFIGKFATQFMSLLLLPLFTHYLLTDDYGTVDLLQTYITLFVPILTLKIDSAVFRFLIDKRKDKDGQKEIVSSIMFILVIMLLITILIGGITYYFLDIKYYGYVIVNIIVLMFSSVMLQILRGLGKTKEYSIGSIITGVVALVVNIILIVGYKFGANSILIASIIANIICSIYVIFNVKLFELIHISKVNKANLKEILAYALPMIPNSLSWWLVNVSDRTIITFFIGATFNGIYTVSCKFSNIINSIFSIFNMSWQESASIHINDEDRDIFFSNMINRILFLFASGTLLVLVAIPIFFQILIGEEYQSAYDYIPILLYSDSWNILVYLIGGIYVAKKETKKVANTTIGAAIINLIIHIVLIKFIGLYAACISTLISYIVMGIYRYLDCQKYVKLRINIKRIISYTIVFGICSAAYIINNIYLNILNVVIAVIYILISNRQDIKAGGKIVLMKVKKTKVK